tara:strand:- start:414 stop:842 length:429 start_codon:yes stop_codon:yes gene_type:complete
MINKDRIFNLFSTTPEVKEKEEKRISIEEFIESPYAKIGMFTKLILNHYVFQEKLKKFLKTEEPAYSIENTKEAANYTVFNKAWEYIREIDIENKDHINALIGFNPIVFNKALTSAIVYFQDGEEYEKCAHIFKIQEIVKEI